MKEKKGKIVNGMWKDLIVTFSSDGKAINYNSNYGSSYCNFGLFIGQINQNKIMKPRIIHFIVQTKRK